MKPAAAGGLGFQEQKERRTGMYLHLGQDVMVKKSAILGIFDLENSTVSPLTRQYLAAAEKNGRVVNVSMEMPKSFIVCCEGDTRSGQEKSCTVYISQISAATLRKRTKYYLGMPL